MVTCQTRDSVRQYLARILWVLNERRYTAFGSSLNSVKPQVTCAQAVGSWFRWRIIVRMLSTRCTRVRNLHWKLWRGLVSLCITSEWARCSECRKLCLFLLLTLITAWLVHVAIASNGTYKQTNRRHCSMSEHFACIDSNRCVGVVYQEKGVRRIELHRLDNQIHFYTIPMLDPIPSNVIRPIRNVISFTVDDQYLKLHPSGDPYNQIPPVEFCVIKRASIAMYTLKDRLLLQKVRSLEFCNLLYMFKSNPGNTKCT